MPGMRSSARADWGLLEGLLREFDGLLEVARLGLRGGPSVPIFGLFPSCLLQRLPRACHRVLPIADAAVRRGHQGPGLVAERFRLCGRALIAVELGEGILRLMPHGQ